MFLKRFVKRKDKPTESAEPPTEASSGSPQEVDLVNMPFKEYADHLVKGMVSNLNRQVLREHPTAESPRNPTRASLANDPEGLARHVARTDQILNDMVATLRHKGQQAEQALRQCQAPPGTAWTRARSQRDDARMPLDLTDEDLATAAAACRAMAYQESARAKRMENPTLRGPIESAAQRYARLAEKLDAARKTRGRTSISK